ncbi:hypothetical protein [Yersinia ruckeri]|uniref:hypothetical protein n=1 Tax=Yersinia ruckeri TaxID=29486 RepID=UPI0008FE006A|nr:hypothetical protein [Yersinia ruckeri]OJB95758.1 hypothetical protein AXW59_07385 [Yersinia ruckeri]OJB98559.1 hypothetical protein AXW58_07365 [Yersinia ruckeri]OJC00207.1 hypothetical protein AXW57_07380 [Yersinia ruckeri]
MSAKVYGLDSSLIHDASPKGGFVVDVVRFSDYAVLEKKCQSLVAENAVMKEIINSVTDLDNEPKYHSEGMGCGLEDRGITDRYDAMQHGWECAMERVYGEVIPCAEELDFTATTQALNEIKAQSIETAADDLSGQNNIGAYGHDAMYAYAASLRGGE